MTAEVEGGLELASPLRMIGADGGTGGSGTAKGVPVSQSHNDRLSGRRAMPSHEGGALDQIAQPPSCIAITHIIDSRYHILLMPLISLVSLLMGCCFPYAAVAPCDRVRRMLPPWRLARIAARPRLADQRAPA
jgi:hypothetical protein